MNYWIISDTHFNHEKLTEWGGRSGDWQEQIWQGIENIPKGDMLIHLGDICIGDDEAVHDNFQHARIGTRTVLVRGNHDGKSLNWYQDHGWDFACDSFELIYGGHYILFSHRPQPPMGHYTKNIHGHTHGNSHRAEEYLAFYDPTYHIDVSPELRGYKPILLDSLLKKSP